MPSVPKNPKPWIWFVVAVALLAIAWGITEARLDPKPNLRHPAIIDSAYFAFALWAGSVLLQLQTPRGEWLPGGSTFRVARAAWVAGCAVFLVHLGLAFHLAHGWSHANAFEHVERSSGFGPGIFVSYLFTLVWVVDAAIWMLTPAHYARRPMGLAVGLHGFMAFITFNATIVFGQSPLRWVAAVVFALLAGQWLKDRLVARTAFVAPQH